MRTRSARLAGTTLTVLLAVLAGCPTGGGGGDDECVEAMAGTWEGSGDCFAMAMTNTAAVDGCAITFSDWSMSGEDLPTGASIDGSAVTLSGTGWTDCTGTIADSGMSIEGTCPDGCAFTLAMQE
ncbi:MAG: hypothetical protein IT382_07470 [Deltaproteobacteria bacterium]|nr:hypothetical protein [Deltaproteobacteria bacterium]